ncbi:efflux RND transporter periplasmic adaptor subunit [Marinobacter salicampi]|uniref:efflux RND transporter periplasmic adaptor subunit n=1 Tax=Marinobacter salicampi TaxID=435907 RepID=UPI00140D94C2|nr:efflux RND transporter periplasmic adaptor subunit [Marinobacter salicampi]
MRIAVLAVVTAIAFVAGWFGSQHLAPMDHGDMAGSSEPQSGEKEPLYWVAPMDPDYQRDKPGKSPMGMDLVPVYETSDSGSDDGGVRISPSVRANLGVTTDTVTLGPVTASVPTVGYVRNNEDKLAHVHSRIPGWIEVLHVKSVGDSVKQGEPLFEIYSPELINAQHEYLLSQRMASGASAGASGKLRSFGFTENQIEALKKRGTAQERVTVFAPASGYVSTLNARTGMYVRPDVEIMAIASSQEVWVVAEFFERQAGLVKTGQSVTFTTPAQPGEQWQGTIDYVYPELDASTRTLQARIRVPNGYGKLKPNMFVELVMDAPLGEDLLTIPRPALIQTPDHQHVLVAEGDGYFRPVLVKTGRETGDRVVVLEGLEEGQEVVTSAQFLIDSESNIDAALKRLEPREPGATGDQDADRDRPLVTTTGEITELDPDASQVTLRHEPIPELGWPAMTMAFELSDQIEINELELGQGIRFSFRETDLGYRVEEVAPLNKPKPAPEAQ